MKLVIQIPCFNEQDTLPETIRDLPKKIAGIDSIELLIIDDGSEDGTSTVAKKYGAKVVRHPHNRGLAAAFSTGLDAALKMGADIIVNTDADNQYPGKEIAGIVAPIIAGKADVVIGARPISKHPHFSPVKKVLQKLGSWVVRTVSGTSVPDAPSGFRAFSRDAASRINIFSSYTYTLETIIQCGVKNMRVVSVPISVNSDTRESRLVKSIRSYIIKSILTIGKIILLYRSFRFFMLIGSLLFVTGSVLGLRFLFFYVAGGGAGHIQSLILAAVLMISGFQTILIGIVTDLVASNRKLLEEVRAFQRFHSDEDRQG